MDRIYMIKYTLTRKPQNKLQKELDELLSVDDRILLKESDFDKYKESVDRELKKLTKPTSGVGLKIILTKLGGTFTASLMIANYI